MDTSRLQSADLTFSAIDVETANESYASICQIGIVHVQDGQVRDTWESLVDPEDYFSAVNISIHGIQEKDVAASSNFPAIFEDLQRQLTGRVVVSHTSFDRVALNDATDLHRLERLDVTWLDSARIVRRAWPEDFARRGWGLSKVATKLGIEFQHHDALEDARATAEIVLRACESINFDIPGWLQRVERRISPRLRPAQKQVISRTGNPEGPLAGEVVVFTGALAMPRDEVSRLAAEAGCNVRNAVTGKTTMLVVGLQDHRKLKGHAKSSKQRKAESMIAKGASIEILSEADFCDIADIDMPVLAPKEPPKPVSLGIRGVITTEWKKGGFDIKLE